MKLTLKVFLAGILTALGGALGNAQIIYSNDFGLGAALTINGTAPTVANTFAGGSGSATWNSAVGTHDLGATLANGTVDATENSVLLPFSPQSGYIYNLVASVTFTSNPGNWISLGFAGASPLNQATNSARFSDSSVNGADWLIANPTSANEQFFAGPRTAPTGGIGSANLLNGLGTYTLDVELDTTGTKWKIASFINGIQLGTNYTYAANPTVVAAGFGQNILTTGNGIQWNQIELIATTPEPSPLALMGLGMAGWYVYGRRQK